MMKESFVKSMEQPSADQWLAEAKKDQSAENIGMYLIHNGTVRKSPKAKVREGAEDTRPVTGMFFSYDEEGVKQAIEEAYQLPGVYYIRVWLNKGELQVGDSIMMVLVGGDIRPHVIDGLQQLVEKIKTQCVTEQEKY